MVTPGKNYPALPAFLPTPDTIPEASACRSLSIPASEEWLGLFMGALNVLSSEWAYFYWGSVTPAAAAAKWNDIINDCYLALPNAACAVPESVPTPFWDEDTDVDDEATILTQTWYGTVSDPEAPPGQLTFVENAAIWTFTGFLALATIEVGAAPAILFNTIAPKFVLATRRGDLGAIIRILVDGEEATRVDTSSAMPGDVIRTNIIANPALSNHDVMLVQVS